MSSALPPRSNQPKAESADSPVSSETEKDNYTLDEMMKALRDGEREREAAGEIVTREDGSVVHRVKRRKRRTDQPAKAKSKTPEKKKKRFFWKLIVAVSLSLFAVLGVLFTLVGYNSKAYREKVEEKASTWTGAEVEFKGLKMMPGQISMTTASFKWPEYSYLRDLELRNLSGHVDLTSFLWARLGGRELGGKVGVLNLQMPAGEGLVGENLEEEDFPFGFQGYYCDALDIYFGEDSPFAVKGTDTSFRYINGSGFRASLDQGRFVIDGWEDLPIQNAVFKFSSDQVDMETLILSEPERNRVGSSSSIKLSGLIPLTKGEKIQMDLTTSGYEMEYLFGKQMGSLFSGEVGMVEGHVNYTFGEKTFDEVWFTFDSFEVQLKKLPFLNDLDRMFPQEGYNEIYFDREIKGAFRADSRGVVVEGLQMWSKDTLKLKGDILISKSGRIAGALTLSINNGLIESEPKVKSLPAFAGKEDQAYHSVQFEIEGTLEEPNDTFRKVIGLVNSPELIEESSGLDLDKAWEKLLQDGAEKTPEKED